jgi:DNA-binding transcriptional LysR family regulator
MDIEVFHQYIVAAKRLSFSEAARELNLTQPSLSRNIAALEKAVGQELFTRSRPLRLTPAGRLALTQISDIWSGYEGLGISMKALAESLKGKVRVQDISDLTSGMNVIAQAVREMELHYPNTDIELVKPSHKRLGQALSKGLTDVEFAYTLDGKTPTFDDEDYIVERVMAYKNEMFICTERDHPLAMREHLKLADFKNERFIRPIGDEDNTLYRAFEEVCLEHGFKPKFDAVSSYSTQEYYMLSMKGRVSFFSKTMIEQMKTMPFIGDYLAFPNVADVRLPLALYMIYRRGTENPAVLAFVEQVNVGDRGTRGS